MYLVAGEAANPASDPVVGSLVLPLTPVLTTEVPESKADLPLGSYEGDMGGEEDASEGPLKFGGATSFFKGSIACSDEVTDFVAGGTIITVSADVSSLPVAWTLVPPEETPVEEYHTALAELMEGPAGTSQTFALTSRDDSCLPPLDLGPGVWSYEPPPPPEEPEEKADDADAGAEGEEVAPTVTVGTWTLKFGTGKPIFMTRDSRLRLRRSLTTNGESLEFVLTRSGGALKAGGGGDPKAKGKGKGGPAPAAVAREPDWSTLIVVDPELLLGEGITEFSPPGTATPRHFVLG